MAKSQHIIELNGQQYDALTGKIVVASPTKTSPPKSAKALKNAPKHVDGFVRRPGNIGADPRHAAPATKAVHQQPAKSQTLMRTAVKKPVNKKIHAKATPATTPKQSSPDAPNSYVSSIKPGRAIRAVHIGQSSLISKFGKSAPSIKNEVVPVKPAPAHIAKPAASKPKPTTHETQPAKPKKSSDPFHKAIENAVSHDQPKAKKPRVHHKIARTLHVSPRLVSFVGVSVLALGISGFLAYQNLPELAMRVASTRAGLNASLPSYQPAGFSMAGPIKYEPGTVTVNYKSNSDDRTFNVTQKNSSWNSETLLENYVSPTKEPYQTFQANGRTIYIYEGNKATWVDGGVWYNVDGETNLNSDQLLRIAESL